MNIKYPKCCKCNKEVEEFYYHEDIDRQLLVIKVKCHGEEEIYELTKEYLYTPSLGRFVTLSGRENKGNIYLIYSAFEDNPKMVK